MTDYEINRRLAEIAGHARWIAERQSFERQGIVSLKQGNPVAYSRDEYPPAWSPLTNWSQLGPLMERFETDVLLYKGTNQVDVYVGDRAGGHTSTDLKRAICLAIITAHEEGTT